MKKAFTLVEMIVAMAVSAIIVSATYASYELVANQYKRIVDIAELHSSGRSIMQMIEREVRMAGFEYRDANGTVTYGGISSPLAIKDSGNKCCDEVTLIYDDVEDVVNAQGEVTSSSVERIKIRFWTEAYSSNKGDRFRLYKQKTILGRNNALLSSPIVSNKEVMADYIEDFQISNIITASSLFTANNGGYIRSYDPVSNQWGLQTMQRTKSGGRLEVYSLAYGDGMLYAANDGGYIRSYDPVKDQWGLQIMHQTKTGSKLGVSALAYGNGLLYTANNGGYIRSYDPVFNQWGLQTMQRTKSGGRLEVYSLAYGDGMLYAANDGGYIRSYDPVKDQWDLQIMHQTKTGARLGVSALATKTKRTGEESLVNINLTLRAKNEYGKNKQFKKKDYFDGNFKIDKTDKYKRDIFSTTVLVRNLIL